MEEPVYWSSPIWLVCAVISFFLQDWEENPWTCGGIALLLGPIFLGLVVIGKIFHSRSHPKINSAPRHLPGNTDKQNLEIEAEELIDKSALYAKNRAIAKELTAKRAAAENDTTDSSI